MTTAPLTSAELRLPSRLGYEKVAMNTAASVARLMGFSTDRIEDLKTAVAEACINAIEHGNKLDEKLSVVVVLSIEPNTLEVRVVDAGTGMTAPVSSEAPDIDAKMHGEDDPRGLGLFLIQSLVDEAEFVSQPLGGSYARLVIHLDKESE
ncbi:MAG: ATP-binding protein [Acidobacteria bacterium]|nr:ATP-binding protein [Acidobacteriota bacterium]